MKTFFWMAVVVSFVGSISCIGYAGMQTVPAQKTSIDGTVQLRSPISFVRDAR